MWKLFLLSNYSKLLIPEPTNRGSAALERSVDVPHSTNSLDGFVQLDCASNVGIVSTLGAVDIGFPVLFIKEKHMTKVKIKPTINIKAMEASWVWQVNGACRDMDSNLFYYEDQERGPAKEARIAKAKAVCQGCSVKTECLEFALEINERYGIWGGLTEEERQSVKRRRQRQQAKQKQ